jgi:hypothetical protein
MAKVLVAVATQPQIVPIGPAQGKLRIVIFAADNTPFASQDVDLPAAEFVGVPSGAYTAAAQRLDVDGNAVPGIQTVTKAFDVPPETMTIDAPMELTISVTLGAAGAIGV